MRNLFKNWGYVILSGLAGLAIAITVVRCGSSSSSSGPNFVQVERLARPVINEALVIQNAHLNAFNSIPPSVDLTPAAAAVVADAATTLEAVYAGVCLINGAVGTALKPGGQTCAATKLTDTSSSTHDGILNSNAIGLDSTFATSAANYANYIAGGFLPDVMRIDTAVASGYNGELCNGGAAGGAPFLCGGRKLDDDVMGITYAFLFNGETSPSTYSALRPGTYYNPAVTDTTCTSVGVGGKCNNAGPAYTNARQGHKAVNATMPFGPAPWL